MSRIRIVRACASLVVVAAVLLSAGLGHSACGKGEGKKGDKPAEAKGPKKVTLPVSGLEEKATRDALEAALQSVPGVGSAKAEPGKLMLEVAADATVALAEVSEAVKGVSNDKAKVEVDWKALQLNNDCRLAVEGVGTEDAAKTAEALKGVGEVANVEAADGLYSVSFKSAKGATLADFDAALSKAFAAKEGEVVAHVSNVLWAAPKAENPGMACGKGGCGKGACGGGKK